MYTVKFSVHISNSWRQKLPYKFCKLKAALQNKFIIQTSQQINSVKNMSTACKSPSKNNILIRVIKPREHQEVLDFLRLHYYREEPLTAGSEPKQPDKEDEDCNMSLLSHGTSLIAFQNIGIDSHKSIFGILISGPKRIDEAERLFEKAVKMGPTKMGHILQFSALIERDANIFVKFNVRKVLHIHVLVVNREERGKNIGYRLVEEVLIQSKISNYELVTVDCTSFYSAKLFERMGFQCINKKYYKDYVDKFGNQIFKPDLPHECAKTFALKLKP